MQIASLIVSIVAAAVAGVSFFLAQLADVRSRKAETIRNLLGEKETVAFGALKLMRDGLPNNDKERRLIVDSVIQACLLEGSDRARALLYRVIETNPQRHSEFIRSLRSLEDTFSSMSQYSFTKEDLDLSRGERRIKAVRKVVGADSDNQRRVSG
jgi:hypothetical protein